MSAPADNPTPKAAPWAMVAADDQETLCRECGAGRLAVWYRLSLYAVKAQSPRFPATRRSLAYDCGLTREAVRQHLADLERIGFIAVERSRIEGRGDMANVFAILRGPYAPPWPKNGPPVAKKDEAIRGQKMATFPRTLLQDLQEAPPRPSTGAAPKGLATAAQAAALYNLYPRKTGKGTALKAIGKALRSEPFETLREAVTAYADAVAQWPLDDRQFIPHPATWFNGQRWADDRETWKRSERQDRPRTTATIRAPADDYTHIKNEVLQ